MLNPNPATWWYQEVVFGRWLGDEGGALRNGISALIKGSSFAPSTMRTQWEASNLQFEEAPSWTWPCWHALNLRPAASRTGRTKCLLFTIHPRARGDWDSFLPPPRSGQLTVQHFLICKPSKPKRKRKKGIHHAALCSCYLMMPLLSPRHWLFLNYS